MIPPTDIPVAAIVALVFSVAAIALGIVAIVRNRGSASSPGVIIVEVFNGSVYGVRFGDQLVPFESQFIQAAQTRERCIQYRELRNRFARVVSVKIEQRSLDDADHDPTLNGPCAA